MNELFKALSDPTRRKILDLQSRPISDKYANLTVNPVLPRVQRVFLSKL